MPAIIHVVCSNCDGRGSDPAALIISIVAAVGTVLLAIFGIPALLAARKANALRGYLDFFREYRRYEPDRRYVLRELRHHDARLGISELPDEAREPAVNVCHYLDHLGFLVHRKMIDLDAVAGLMGPSVLVCWKALAPYIERERERRRVPDYARYFEDLVAKVYATPIKALYRELERVPVTAELPGAVLPGGS